MTRTDRTASRVPAHLGRRKTRVTAALYKKTRCLGLKSPVSTPLAYKPRASTAKQTDNGEIMQQAAARKHAVKTARRCSEVKLWDSYRKVRRDTARCEEARNHLWVHYQPLVRYISERLKTKLPECIEVGDLVGAGNIGLQDAISKFAEEKNVRFETYCVPRIRGAILDYIRQLDWVPRLIRLKAHQLERIVGELAADLKREPTDDEIARRIGITADDLAELRKELQVKAQISVEGCNKNNTDDRDRMRIEMIEERCEVRPTRELEREEIRRMALRGLNTKERAVIEQYYFNGRSMKQIGEELQLSESRICQIHSGVLEVLRKKFRAYADAPYID